MLSKFRIMVAAGVLALGAGAAVPALGDSSPSLSSAQGIDLQADFDQALPTASAGPVRGVIPAYGQQSQNYVRTACQGSGCPMSYFGGPVQHHPSVYLLFWGPDWQTDPSQVATASYLVSFFSGLGVEPQDTWSATTSQYTDSSGTGPSFGGPVLARSIVDTQAPPANVTRQQMAAEADAYARRFGIVSDVNAQIVIATQRGTCPEGFAGDGCSAGYNCGWHTYSTSTMVPFVNLPYETGICARISVQNQYDSFSIAGGHEYAETITDPYLNAWARWDGEIADICLDAGQSAISLSTGNFVMQSLWSNSDGDCVMVPGAGSLQSGPANNQTTQVGRQQDLSTSVGPNGNPPGQAGIATRPGSNPPGYSN